MIEITDKSKCCGCTACYNICPTNAISMNADNEGFLYPIVDKGKCINCGRCNSVCPIINKKSSEIETKAYSMRTKDNEILSRSTSGGFFTPIAKYVLKKNGIVFGVGYNNQMKVIHKRISKEEEIKELVGSKYVQSYLGNSFKTIKELLDKQILVLFSGTPCQVAGLKNFLNKKYENLITLDVICHGTPSPKLWREYIIYQEKKYKSKIKEAYFRNKTYGYHSGTMKLVFESGKKYYGSARVDYMLKSFFKEISSRPSCYECAFKNKRHCSDFTIFDCWHISKVVKGIKDDDKGYTNLFVNSMKGQNLIKEFLEEIYLYEVDIEQIIKLDGIMVENSTKPHPNREQFYNTIDKEGLENAIKKYIPITKQDKIIEKEKLIIYKLGLIKLARKIKMIINRNSK